MKDEVWADLISLVTALKSGIEKEKVVTFNQFYDAEKIRFTDAGLIVID